MRIMIICNNALGLYVFREKLISTLIDKGNEVCAILPRSDDNIEKTARYNLEGIGCKTLFVTMKSREINIIDELKLLKSFKDIIKKEKPDLVITYTIKPNVYGGIMCRLLKVPYVSNITGLGTLFQNDGILKKIATILYKVSLKKAKVVFFENEENRQIFLTLGIIKEEQTHLLNGAGVDLQRFSYQPYPEEYDDETRFLFIGRVMHEKGVNELFAAMKSLHDDGIPCTLDIIGKYEEDYAGTIDCCAAQGWLFYHGYQSDVRPYIANCHCLVLPSWHEGMANTILECAASGRPVITSNISGCREGVIDRQTGLLHEVRNSLDLYRKMKRLCFTSFKERESMGIRGREFMKEVFDKEKVVEETIKTIMEKYNEV